MFASKKGILGNLNHIRLQHVSLGLHLSLRPEMQEGPITRAPSEPEEQTAGCQHCQEETTGNFEVDANSNNTAAQCRCCESHPHQLLKSGLLNEPPSHVENVGDHKEEATSPTDAVLSTLSVSSSISSCSDFTLEETPVSFYCREFLSDGIPSPENQPDIIPLEDSVVNANCLTSEQAQLRHPSEDRYSGPDPLEVDQPRYLTLEKEGEKIYHDLLHSDPSGVFLEIPERPWNKKIEEEMDSHHNTISGLQVQSSSIPPNITEEQDTSFNKIPRTRSISDQKCLPLTKIGPASQVWSVEDGKTTLDDLFGAAEVPQIKCERSLPSVLERTQEGRPGDTKKNITSFHELAQRRKRATTGTTPQPAKKDRSDWLITFSPDTELPPVNELTSSVLYQRYEGMDTSISKQANPDKHSQTGVTTFKELRFRSTLNKQSNQQGKVQGVWEPLDQSDTQRPGTSRIEPNMNIHLGSDNKEPPNRDLSHFKGPLPAHVEAKQRRGLSRHSLQPIAESHLGGTEASWTDSLEEGSATPLGQRCTATGNDPWSRGKADGGDRHSKEGLLVAVSSSVDKIISHFSTTRNIVQKAQLGDSWLSPEVGHLILNTLCPALYALVGDGLKPFQKDVIVGRRRTSPWTVVEASVKPGPATRPLHNLYSRICQLPQLGSSKNKFNTFVFGLLNAKLLDFWVSHLQEHSGTLSWLYLPGGFLSITKDSFYSFFEELLLVLQPLSILTFHLDLLFEHHHLRVNLRLLQPSAGTSSCQAQGHAPSTGLKQGEGCSPREAAAGQCSEDDKQQQEHTAAKNRTVCIGSEQKRPFQNPAPISKQCTDAQSSGPLQNTFEQVLQWGNKLTHTLVGSEESPAVAKVPVKETCTKSSDKSREDTDVKAKTWWGQLSQASQVYSTLNREGFPFTRWTKIKMSTVDKFPAASPNLSAGKTKSEREVTNHKKQYERNQTKEHHEGGSSRATRATLDQPKKKTDGSEAQESQDEGHKKNQETYEEGNQEPRSEEAPEQGSPGIQESSLHETPVRHESSDYVSPLTQELSDREAQRSHKLHDDGTHVFGTQEMLDRNSQGLMTPNFQMKEDRGTIADAGPHKDPHRREAESPSRGIWLGHLFGAPCSSTKRSPSDVETNGVKSRRPSSWLPPNMNVLELMRKVVPPEKTALPEESSKVPVEAPKLIRTVRAICDHTGSSGSHLSFQKDEVLQLLSTVDDDWIRCCHGSNTGLVPVAYTSLIL
ncbi:AP-4 complex accessory subunit RUSC1 isoform X3 [Pleurodeles waltl]|uniref:AP-4 complex accessory subunit RUSC1 isoform X3 n=1 Tax=Pleurodeles waltl TaxID=8319 RepID=UPI00370967E8